MTQLNLEEYSNFVHSKTSQPSLDFDAYLASLRELQKHVNVAQLDTALTGINSEAGEALDLLKKLKFQGKPWTDEIRDKFIAEAGDVLFYWVHLCMALGIKPQDVIDGNVDKLDGRYGKGSGFSVERSENRKD